MNKLLISVATCGILLSSVAFAAPIPSAASGLSAGDTTTIQQVKMSKKMMMMKKKKMMMKKKMM